MTVVALRLAGPLQAWGSRSRFVRRETEKAPTKSGVIGMVAAAKGIRRTDPLEELADLRFGVRIDQPGQLLRDFQTAQRPKKEKDGTTSWSSLPLSQRYYVSDAVFLAVLEGERRLVEDIDEAVRSPEFPLYLGRRSCPPAGPVALGVFDSGLEEALATLPWMAGTRRQQRHRANTVRLTTVRDAHPDETDGELVQDIPVSFDPNRRQYAWRTITRGTVEIDNPHGTAEKAEEHDPMASLGG
ncbi:type I-E CRISPR-associated protein Cas5/CasD [Actinopolyspora erythraea]|uniref:CRISPR-associated protein Cas5 n=1 Tax=Actinopolyspora erythraea TaxID=414996 RepID=A0A099D1Z6_9ACTN|nr:type I-E CRISPR-associated protein Cas5/CasD [Actinopolyspora erythraea]ASU77287.1 type I-E CRISPR-associated protein Cas5/CasD [Actinopolyspora erythraea]KGI80228.1 CRISPR-associated protein Cas5 [Actinopolyspora erythraea]